MQCGSAGFLWQGWRFKSVVCAEIRSLNTIKPFIRLSDHAIEIDIRGERTGAIQKSDSRICLFLLTGGIS